MHICDSVEEAERNFKRVMINGIIRGWLLVEKIAVGQCSMTDLKEKYRDALFLIGDTSQAAILSRMVRSLLIKERSATVLPI